MTVGGLTTEARSVGDVVVVYISGIRHLGHIKTVVPVDEVVKEVTIKVQEA